jgi:serine/threonine protein kinase/alpha-tubulin suppressor-like RCC1 family protein
MDELDDSVADLNAEYEMLGELGRGGSAIVFHARDRSLGREVAIKVVRPRFGTSDDDALQRLAREARTVAGLQHPNIVTVYAVKRLHDGGLALVMQLVPGRTLKQAIVEGGAMSPMMVEHVIRDVASALAYAHSHGVVHRDVKPENIFLDVTSGRALLSDFGIAQSNEFDSRLTMTGTAIGTPAYMSPEQIDGKATDPRSDVYSLGLVAWEMLTGERPWEGETLYNVIYKQKHDELPAVDSLRPGVPLRLQYMVERMLQKRPAARWGGADGLLAFMNASVLPSDWGQWQEAHRKRRLREKAAAAADAESFTRPAGFVSAALATIRFRRKDPDDAGAGGDDADGEPARRAAAIAAAAAATTSSTATVGDWNDREDSEADAVPSWAREAPQRSGHRRLAFLAGLLVLLAGGSAVVAITRQRARSDTPPSVLNDVATVQVPVGVASNPAPTASAPGADADSVAARLRDSLAMLSNALDVASATASTTPPGAPPASPPAAVTNEGALAPMPPVRTPPAGTSSGAPPRPTLPRAAGTADLQVPIPPRPLPRVTTTPGAGTPPAPVLPAAPAGPPSNEGSSAGAVRATDDRAIVAAGGRHSCVLENGKALCWGANEAGQLGDGELEPRSTPEPIKGDLEFVSLAAGGLAHSCGVTRTGDAYCWGSDEHGQLGDATTTSRSAPVRVAGSLNFRVLRTGLAHTCGLTTDGYIACWGRNSKGQVGDNTTANRSSPLLLVARVRFISVTAGWNHSCGIATDGSAFCWGDNSTGQLGDGTRTPRLAPQLVAGGVRFTSIAAGANHTCAVSDSGEAYCWGRNEWGQLGTGDQIDRTTPARVATSTRFASVTSGSVHSCARTSGGAAFCWGRNTYGQLGDGSTTNRPAPVRVAAVNTFTAVSATGAHTCGTSPDGSTSCWGFNNDGQLGDGSRNHRSRPLRISIPGR